MGLGGIITTLAIGKMGEGYLQGLNEGIVKKQQLEQSKAQTKLIQEQANIYAEKARELQANADFALANLGFSAPAQPVAVDPTGSEATAQPAPAQPHPQPGNGTSDMISQILSQIQSFAREEAAKAEQPMAPGITSARAPKPGSGQKSDGLMKDVSVSGEKTAVADYVGLETLKARQAQLSAALSKVVDDWNSAPKRIADGIRAEAKAKGITLSNEELSLRVGRAMTSAESAKTRAYHDQLLGLAQQNQLAITLAENKEAVTSYGSMIRSLPPADGSTKTDFAEHAKFIENYKKASVQLPGLPLISSVKDGRGRYLRGKIVDQAVEIVDTLPDGGSAPRLDKDGKPVTMQLQVVVPDGTGYSFGEAVVSVAAAGNYNPNEFAKLLFDEEKMILEMEANKANAERAARVSEAAAKPSTTETIEYYEGVDLIGKALNGKQKFVTQDLEDVKGGVRELYHKMAQDEAKASMGNDIAVLSAPNFDQKVMAKAVEIQKDPNYPKRFADRYGLAIGTEDDAFTVAIGGAKFDIRSKFSMNGVPLGEMNIIKKRTERTTTRGSGIVTPRDEPKRERPRPRQ